VRTRIFAAIDLAIGLLTIIVQFVATGRLMARFGVGPADRVSPAAAPALHGALEAATRALSGRPLALFCGRRPGLYAALENTRPPSLVLAADVASMTPGAIAFTTARSASLAVAGWALLGKFAPRDVLILCELAARFAADTVDQKGIDGLVNGVGVLVRTMGERLRPLQTGFVRQYGLSIVAGAVALLAWFLSRGGF